MENCLYQFNVSGCVVFEECSLDQELGLLAQQRVVARWRIKKKQYGVQQFIDDLTKMLEGEFPGLSLYSLFKPGDGGTERE